MKIWIFICGVVLCSLLFFTSGTLVGYSACETQIKNAIEEKTKPTRKPSAVERLIKPIIGVYSTRVSMGIRDRARLPSSPAITRAHQYKAMIDSGN